MKSSCLKCRKDAENRNPKVLVMVKQWYYPNVQYAAVKNQDVLKIKKQKYY